MSAIKHSHLSGELLSESNRHIDVSRIWFDHEAYPLPGLGGDQRRAGVYCILSALMEQI